MHRDVGGAPLVSVVIPVFNGSDFLSEAIESALDQTYKNIEVLVVNDGSRDRGKTRVVASKYEKHIRYFEKLNGGCGSALNMGIREAKGTYFSWLSHDDVYLSTHLVSLMDCIRISNQPNAVAYGAWLNVDASLKTLEEVTPSNKLPLELINDPFSAISLALIHGCSLLVPIDLLKQNSMFREDLPTTQDYDAWLRILPTAPLVHSPSHTLLSRQHPKQGSRSIAGHTAEADEFYLQIVNYAFTLLDNNQEMASLLIMLIERHLAPSGYIKSKSRFIKELKARGIPND